jgi:1,4-alpha-glucan branching enzyme
MTVLQLAKGWGSLLEGDALDHLEREALPAFLPLQRWYAGKARALDSVRIVDAAQPEGFPATTFLAFAEVRYREGGADTYFLPFGVASGAEAGRLAREAPGRIIATVGGPGGESVVYDALADPSACWALLMAIEQDRTIPTRSGQVRGIPTSSYAGTRGPSGTPMEVVRGTAEQSNSAVLFDNRLLMKVFRRIEPGINPDFEIGRFLTERAHFDRIPRAAGTIEYHRRGVEPATLAILQGLVLNQGTGWEHALHELGRYYEETSRRPAPADPVPGADGSYLELSEGPIPDAVRRAVGSYLKDAAALGRRTAELHRALASDPQDPEFAPEPLSAADLSSLKESIREQFEQTLAVLRENLGGLPEGVGLQARRVLDEAPGLLAQLDELPALNPGSTKIRCHGDYHLGQVLRTDEDFVILDFEGEPAKTLRQRREKQTPIKDVVGMLRSFDYAAFAALFAFTKDRPEDFGRLAPWAKLWRTWTSAAFLKAYREAADGASFLPPDRGAFAALLRAFTLDKALYELLYELNNRPDWVQIPLQGILALLAQAEGVAPAPPAGPLRAEAGPETVSASLLSDFDLHLLAEGTHYRSYEKLGAQVIERHGAIATSFAVWAPNAVEVSVVGDFNGWDPKAHPMRTRGHSGIWERVVPGLGPGARYKYAVVAADGTRVDKADPYGFAADVRPQTASRVWDLSTYEWGDGDWMASRRGSNALSAPISIYEVHLGSWMRVPEEGDRWLSYRELAPKLADYVGGMGYTHVEILPIAEHPFDGSWGYQTTGYYAPTSRFGTPDDFMHFVDTLHRRGIGVILDWVPAHFPTDEHGLGLFDGTHLYEHADPRRGFHQDWDTYIFDYGRPQVANFLISNALFWLDRYHVDGLRVDAVASMLYLDYSREDGEWIPNEYGGRENLDAITFLRRTNERVHAEFPDALTIAEESTSWPMVSRPTTVGGLGFDLKWDMGWMHDALSYMELDPLFRRYHHNRLTFRGVYAFSESFVLPLSHDEVVYGKGSLLGKMPGDPWQKFASLRLLLGWMHAQPGKKLLFMGGDFGQWREWNHDASLDWHLLHDPMHQGLQRWVRDLNTRYRGEAALHELDCHPSGFSWVDCCDAEQSIVSLMRKGKAPDRLVLIVCNFTPVPRHNYRVGVPRSGHWDEVLNSDAPLYGGSGQGNVGGVRTSPVAWHGQYQSLNLTLPPLAMLALSWRGTGGR